MLQLYYDFVFDIKKEGFKIRAENHAFKKK